MLQQMAELTDKPIVVAETSTVPGPDVDKGMYIHYTNESSSIHPKVVYSLNASIALVLNSCSCVVSCSTVSLAMVYTRQRHLTHTCHVYTTVPTTVVY
jgi:hypothetical protein